jgi:two-component system, chemotaxis family, sensor kinase Cph1
LQNVTLENCSQEPIHIPGAIQPHGYLMALLGDALTVKQISTNLPQALQSTSDAILEQALGDVLGAKAEGAVRAALSEQTAASGPVVLRLDDQTFEGVLHRHEGIVLLEFEAPIEDDAPVALDEAIHRIQLATDFEVLKTIVVDEVRRLTGFDRVMLYRFDTDGHGQVIAEAKSESLDSFFGLHYPASDIPEQARALYRLNWLRVIPESVYEPVPLLPSMRPDSGRPLDLSYSLLRSVSPIHREYLQNMGLRASTSISIITHGKLWGLLSCGHTTPKRLSYRRRAACETIGRLLSVQIAALEEIEQRRTREAKAAIARPLVEAMRSAPSEVVESLARHPDELLRLTDAAGALIVIGDNVRTVGKCPPAAKLGTLIEWIHRQAGIEGLINLHRLPLEFPEAMAYKDVASGLLAVSLPKPEPNLVVWFRPEVVYTVNWGGDPNKPVEAPAAGDRRLHPRKSFALWKEVVVGQSLRWSEGDVEAAAQLRRFAIEADLEKQVRRERLAVQARDDLIAVVSHDLRNPINAIVMNAAVMKRTLADASDESSRRLHHAVDRIQAVSQHMTTLLNDLLDLSKIEAGRFDVACSMQDSASLVSDACDLLNPIAQHRSISLEIVSNPKLPVLADPERLFQVLSNLIGNAIKFSLDESRILISIRPTDGYAQFEVCDDGPGIREEDLPHLFDRYWQARRDEHKGAGLGLYIARGIVEAHGGRIWVESTHGQGARFFFTIPLADTDAALRRPY